MTDLINVQWRSIPGSSDLRRGVIVKPGYDCRLKCEHEVKGEHGIASAGIEYVIAASDFAVSLMIYTDIYPNLALETEVLVCGVTEHRARPIEDHEIRLGLKPEQVCSYLEAGLCYGTDQAGLRGALLYKDGLKHFDRNAPLEDQQPEKFWTRLQEHFVETHTRYLQALVQAPKRCEHCHGKGVVGP